jgi:two-component system, NtrC family, nitrogen regulation sensor histidine kinase NtrY
MASRSEVPAGGSQAPRQAGIRRIAWAGGGLCVLSLAAWLTHLAGIPLLLAGAGALIWTCLAMPRRLPWARLAGVAMWLAVGAAAGIQYRLSEMVRDWPSLQDSIEVRAASVLKERLDDLVDSGEAAARGVEEIFRSRNGRAATFDRLDQLRRSTGVSALAVFGPDRVPVAWAGEHRGSIPDSVFDLARQYHFEQGPLYGYVYFSHALADGRTAIAAVLLESDLVSEHGTGSFAARFAAETGLVPRFSTPDRAVGESVWDWTTDRTILSVSFAALTQGNWWARIVERGRLGVGILWASAVGLLAIGWYWSAAGAVTLPVALVTLGLVLMPLGEIIGAQGLFSPAQFLLPGPVDVDLGTFLVLLLGVAVWVLIRTAGRDAGVGSFHAGAQGAIAAAVLALTLAVVDDSAALRLLAGRPGGGPTLQLATVLLAAIPLYLVLWAGHREPGRGGRTRAAALLAAGFLLASAMALALVVSWHPSWSFPAPLLAVWGIPFALAAAGISGLPVRYPSLRNWLAAGAFAATAALPALWVMHVQAKLTTAEVQLGQLGTRTDEYLDFLLRTFAERARAFADEGEEGVNLLYHSWVASGLAREGYEARLTIWEDGEPGAELRLSPFPDMPPVVTEVVAAARNTDREVVARYTEVEGLHYLLLLPLPGDRLVSVAVPPRTRFDRATSLARFLQPDPERPGAPVIESLNFVPLEEHPPQLIWAAPETGADEVTWLSTDLGWRSEAHAPFPSGWMHVHLLVRTSTVGLLLARGALVVAALLALFAGLWLVSRLICRELPSFRFLQGAWIGSFRSRLTLALFAFFLVPTAVFTVVAYQAVSREVIRSAAAIGARALDQTVATVARAPLDELGLMVGMDLLLYRQGTLVEASAPEALALGLFDTWLPPQVYLTLAGGEDLEEWQIRTLGENEHLVGYRRFDSDAVFAVPIALASDEISRRQTEFRDIALLMMVLGGTLSVVLALLVGRAFTRPIDELSRAAAAIGAGNLRLQLPETRPDEFGPVYASFNRMARRLRQARAALVSEKRRTETIVSEAATGVLALDSAGRVELVNPRAEEILGTPLQVGASLPADNPLLRAVRDKVEEFRRGGREETGGELDVEGRIVRLRLRRLRAAEGAPGAVVALEDVTDEVRTARVLAWGEMARQVAHEIKNPLTPIKLAVQHLRRAYFDGKKDFGHILDRNVDSILQEIDRLSEIARAFSRFGTPPAAAAELESVDVLQAVNDTLTLYGAGEDVRFRADLDGSDGVRAIARMGELKEVLVNLLENSREAVNGGGEVVVAVRLSPDGGWVDLVVEDTGEGIAPELLPRIFEPHFSTRTSGTGLGLAIVKRLVESWGGEAAAESEPGVGTRVRIRLRADAGTGTGPGM